MTIHELKTDPAFFSAVIHGDKTFELRLNDRGFQKGDVLLLREFDLDRGVIDALRYTGRSCLVDVTYVLSGPWLAPNHVAMAIKRRED